MLTSDFIWFLAYVLVLVGMAGYGFHRLVIIFLYWKHRKNCPMPKGKFDELPRVTIQLPMFNERVVVDRLLESVALIDYPKDKLEIQILDDSIDETTQLCYDKAAELRERGFDCVCLHRSDRTGYKAGALEDATKVAKGEFLFILDADFQPKSDVLMNIIHYFTDEKVGLVQTRWGHINRECNLLTRVQGMFLDGHFVMEQTARNRSGRFFTFNGTAGMWRKCTILDAGGWDHDTLTEDMDLSYRAQMKGWQFIFLKDVVTPAELPVDMDGFKAQQHRWTKGSIQVCQKMLLDIWRSNAPLKAKLEATTHLTANYAYLLLILLCFLIYPVAMKHIDFQSSLFVILLNLALFFFASIAVCIFYVSAQVAIRPRTWWKELPYLPVLLALGIGMSVNNSKAVLEAVFGHQSSFVRTPKYGIGQSTNRKQAGTLRKNGYKAIKSILIPVLELAFGLFFLVMIVQMLQNGKYMSSILMSPFLGFFYTSFCSLGRMIANLMPTRQTDRSQN
ncbi:MAG: glycosyltransferase family 2 protein [Akkermansia sp.]